MKAAIEKRSVRVGDLEFASHGVGFEGPMIVQWVSTNVSRIIAAWRDHCGYRSLHFLDGRPFEVDKEAFWYLAEYGQMFLDRNAQTPAKT